jgi:hypothetical protein
MKETEDILSNVTLQLHIDIANCPRRLTPFCVSVKASNHKHNKCKLFASIQSSYNFAAKFIQIAMSDGLRYVGYEAIAKINAVFKAIPTRVNNPSPNTVTTTHTYTTILACSSVGG